MRRQLRDLRSRVERRAQAWIRRRQGADTDPVELRRQRIYILPTRLGVAYAAMLFAMLLGGLNYNNNLALGLTFLLVSLGLVTMHHAHGTLAGVRLRLLEAMPAFVGNDVRFRPPSRSALPGPGRATSRPTCRRGDRARPRWSCRRSVAAGLHSNASWSRPATRSACSARGPSCIRRTRRSPGPGPPSAR
jgi:hypothetical protein